jgi:hypothetical protein
MTDATILDSIEKKKSKNTTYIVAALAAILTPSAYLLGLNFYQGYMNAFGVEPDGFPISAPDVYVFSYHTVGYFLLSIGEVAAATLDKLTKSPGIYWTAGIICIFIGVVYLRLKVIKNEYPIFLQKLINIFNFVAQILHSLNNDLVKSVGFAGVAIYVLLVGTIAILFITIFWWVFPLSAYTKGKNVATERINLFLEKGCYVDEKTRWNNCYLVLDGKGKVIHEGLLISINDKEIAIFKKDGSYVFLRKEDYMLRRKLL